jgi:hypothetical protein
MFKNIYSRKARKAAAPAVAPRSVTGPVTLGTPTYTAQC